MCNWDELLGAASKADELNAQQLAHLIRDPRTVIHYTGGSVATIYPVDREEALRYHPQSLYEKCILKILHYWTNKHTH